MQQRSPRLAAVGLAVALAAVAPLTACASDDTTRTAEPSMASSASSMPTGASATVGDFELAGFWVKESSLDLSAGFGTIANTGASDDTLVGAEAPDVPMIELHQTVDGVMQQVEGFAVPAGSSLELAPGGNHLMFMGLTEPLVVGEDIEVTLRFESGATASITAPIEPFTTSGHNGM